MKEPRRPAFFENLVFGLALALALIVGFYAVKSVLPGGGAASRPVRPAAPAAIPEKHELASSGTEEAVGSLPPIRVTRAARSRAPKTEVPSPNRKD